MKLKLFTLALLLIGFSIKAQVKPDSIHSNIGLSEYRTFKKNDNRNCLFHIKPSVDIPITVLGIAGTVGGNLLISQKHNSDSASVVNLTEKDVEFPWDKEVTHNYDQNAKSTSDYFLFGGFVYGFTILLDKDIRKDAGKIILLYLETMGLTGTSYEMSSGLVYKYRPYVYNNDYTIVNGQKVPEVSIGEKMSHFARNSFYSGHASVPAASTFFVASVYSVYHPDSRFRYVLYGVAVAATGTTAYLRYKAGEHFPTDLALGVGIGTAYGLVIPKLHRCKDGKGLSLLPMTGNINGIQFSYNF